MSKLRTCVPVVVSEGGLEPPPPYGDQPQLRGSTDTSVALADILKRECAGGCALPCEFFYVGQWPYVRAWCVAAALTNAATKGCGEPGELETWGTKSVATKNGCSGSSMTRTSASWSTPETTRPPALRSAR